MRSRLPLITASVGLILLTGCTPPQEAAPTATHESFWKDKESYEQLYRAVDEASVPALAEPVTAAILPHHLFVGHEIARLYASLRTQDPSVVVVIGPNHYAQGDGMVQATNQDFTTPYGTVTINRALLSDLEKRGLLLVEPKTFDGEHSISTHPAFIKRTFPQATLLPIVLQENTPPQVSTALAEALNELLPKDALVLASVDFSHYMTEAESDVHDAHTHEVITNFRHADVPGIEADSPATIQTLLRYLTLRGSERIVYDRHTNSGQFTVGPPPAETTSHFYMVFTKSTHKK